MKEFEPSQILVSGKVDMWYPVRVWVLDIFLLSPLVLAISATFQDKSYLWKQENWTILFIFMVVGMFLSLPTLAITYLALLFSIRQRLSTRVAEVFSCITANAGLITTFWLLRGSEALTLAILYVIATTISFLIVRLHVTEINLGEDR